MPKSNAVAVPVSFMVPREAYVRLKELAAADRRSLASYVQLALLAHLQCRGDRPPGDPVAEMATAIATRAPRGGRHG